MKDVRPSVPRTIAQQTLHLVSIVMLVLSLVLLLGGVLVVWAGLAGGGTATVDLSALDGTSSLDRGAVLGFGILVIGAADLVAMTATLGLRAADDSSKVGPYRFLCYLVSLVTLVAIVWGWGAGTFLLFHPVVLMTTITYVLVCSTLADQVQREHDEGVVGPVFWRTHHQRTLHLISCAVIAMSAMQAVVAVVLFFMVGSLGADSSLSLVGSAASAGVVSTSDLISGLVSAAVDLVVGILGVRGSNHPDKIMPYLVVSFGGFAVDAARLVVDLVVSGFAGIQGSSLADMVFMATCAYLAWRIRHQPSLDVAIPVEG